MIHQTIVDNLFDNPVVVCDVSTENPNVMFELGLRLAFDKPTIVVVDDKTKIQFDTSPIEHLKYPRDLRFSSIVEFKEKLAEKIQATVERYKDPEFKTFLKAFKRYTPAKLESAELPKADLILQELTRMNRELSKRQGEFERATNNPSRSILFSNAETDEWVSKAEVKFSQSLNADQSNINSAMASTAMWLAQEMLQREPSINFGQHLQIASELVGKIAIKYLLG